MSFYIANLNFQFSKWLFSVKSEYRELNLYNPLFHLRKFKVLRMAFFLPPPSHLNTAPLKVAQLYLCFILLKNLELQFVLCFFSFFFFFYHIFQIFIRCIVVLVLCSSHLGNNLMIALLNEADK